MIDDAGSEENPSKVPGEGGTNGQLPTASSSADGGHVKPVLRRHRDFKNPANETELLDPAPRKRKRHATRPEGPKGAIRRIYGARRFERIGRNELPPDTCE
jgi:hypothetical protein